MRSREGGLSAAGFNHRVLIGRRPFNGVRIDEPTVSRLHAWIARDADGFYIQDAGSRSGTRLNGHGIIEPTKLFEGSKIQIGTSTIVFHESDELPADATPIKISENGTNLEYQDDGFLMECRCGAALWMPARRGVHGRCSRCGDDIEESARVIRPRSPADAVAHHVSSPVLFSREQLANFPQPQPQAAAALCSVCQTSITTGEATERCPACGQTYHAECWAENRGCASYGCAQVGALEPKGEATIDQLPGE
jgi:uncharacterized CHY-type Zn-finger protein